MSSNGCVNLQTVSPECCTSSHEVEGVEITAPAPAAPELHWTGVAIQWPAGAGRAYVTVADEGSTKRFWPASLPNPVARLSLNHDWFARVTLPFVTYSAPPWDARLFLKTV